MKSKFLKIAGVKTEAEFYKKYPSEAAFFKAHPEAKDLKKLKAGGLTGKPGVYPDGYSGTSSAGVYYDLGGSYIFNPMFAQAGILPKYKQGSSKFQTGGYFDFDDQDFNDFATMMMTIGNAFPSKQTSSAKYGGNAKALRKFQGLTQGSQFNTNSSVIGVPATSNPYMWGSLPALGEEPTYQPSAKDIGMQGIPVQATNPFSTLPQMQPSKDSKNTFGKLAAVSGAVGTFLDNRQKRKQAKEKTALDSLADNRSVITPIGVSGQRGDYDQFGIFRPDEYVVNKGMYTSNTPGLQLKQFGGGLIAEATSLPMDEIGMNLDVTAAPSGKEPTSSSEPVKLTTDFKTYAQIADDYIRSVNPETDITGEMLAESAQKTYEKYGRTVPVELALAQLQQEGYLAKTKTPNRPQKTNNPFNYGNTDNPKDNVYFNTVQDGIDKYYTLMASKYLSKKSPEELLQNFVNAAGNRYATDKNYESSLKKIINKINKKSYQDGGVYELTEDEIKDIIARGGNVEFI